MADPGRHRRRLGGRGSGRIVGTRGAAPADRRRGVVLGVHDGRVAARRDGSGRPPFVAPRARGMGVGVALLRAVVREASARGLRAALAVTDGDRAAMALYERCGWQHVGKTPWSWSGGGSIVLHCYLASD
ncbi:MAG TPA: GNAT family N-acetyltransferase [Jiangellaceae bacterium]|nr:GNAT family N-acetyltransferase [Jiangellaceae bacterium]